MSWFTAPANSPQPPCERCKLVVYVSLIKRGVNYDIWDCKKCGDVERKAKQK